MTVDELIEVYPESESVSAMRYKAEARNNMIVLVEVTSGEIFYIWCSNGEEEFSYIERRTITYFNYEFEGKRQVISFTGDGQRIRSRLSDDEDICYGPIGNLIEVFLECGYEFTSVDDIPEEIIGSFDKFYWELFGEKE